MEISKTNIKGLEREEGGISRKCVSSVCFPILFLQACDYQKMVLRNVSTYSSDFSAGHGSGYRTR